MRDRIRAEIIYEDQDIIVARKPAGLAVQTAKVGQQDVVSEIKNYLRQPYLGIIHRLDQPVEGLLVFAKNRNAAAGLTAQLQKQGEGGLHKSYYAVLCGKPSENEGRFVDYLYKDENNKAVIVGNVSVSEGRNAQKEIVMQEGGTAQKETGVPGKRYAAKDPALSAAKRAVLSYRVLQALDSPAGLALAEISIETGRFHQIRAQMAYHGYPLAGDGKYGDDRVTSLSQRLCVKNVALCAWRLGFVHPMTQKNMDFQIMPQGKAFSYFGYFDETHSF